MIDLHVHTARCGHAYGDVPDYIRNADRIGMDVVAMTDHLPLPPSLLAVNPRAAGYAMAEQELADYVQDVLKARDAAALDGGPTVLLGIEADHIPGEEAHVSRLLEQYPFDVVLGSVHMIDGWAFDDPERMEDYARWDIGELWDRYFAQVAQAAASGLFDVMGHTDLVKKFGYIPEDGNDERYRTLAGALAEAGVAIEVNTAGLRKPCAELYPALPLLKAFFDAGVPATIGSDAHSPEEVGYGYDLAVEALREAGYSSVCYFRSRVLQEVGL